MKLEIYLPDELEPFEPHLKFFFDLMVRKLHANRHKGFGAGVSFEQIWNGLCGETKETFDAIVNESQFDVQLEATDVANFAFLLAHRAMLIDKDQFKNDQALFAQKANVAQKVEGATFTRDAELTEASHDHP